MDDTRYCCPGFVLRAHAPDELELCCHSARSTTSTTVDQKGLEFLLRFVEPTTLAEAIAHFQGRGWALEAEVYVTVHQELVAGRLLVPAEAAPATRATVAAADAEDEGIGPARPEEAGAIAALHNELMADIEKKRLAAEGSLGTKRGDALAGLPRLSVEARALLFIMVDRAIRRGERVRARELWERAHRSFYASFVPFADVVAELGAAGYARGDAELELAVPADEIFPVYEALGEELEVGALQREHRLRRTLAENLHLVARDAEGVAGYLEGRFLIHDGVYTEAELVSIIVAERARKGGVGMRLVRALQRVAVEKQVAFIKVPTQRTNERAIAFYERAGFVPEPNDTYLFWSPPSRS